MATTVTITTGARLHFGPFAAAGASGGQFGGMGMMISQPGYEVVGTKSSQDQFLAESESDRVRIREFVERIRQQALPPGDREPVRVQIKRTIPSHSGLGSGTQLGLAIARALSVLHGESTGDPHDLARKAGRGLRSAIGLYGFEHGGFLVDGGRASHQQFGTLVSRVEFPSAWKLILATPPKSQGLSGAAEQQAFSSQPPMPRSLTSELCRIALLEWLPGLINADFARTSQAMYEFGLAVGQFFEPVQGGVFAHPLMNLLATESRRRGFAGVAQTSWGPTTCVLCESESLGRQLLDDLSQIDGLDQCDFQISEPLNRGASIQVD